MTQINSRIKQRYDTLANWTSNNIVLLNGELAIVDCGEQTKFKVGNGISAFNQLSFVDQNVLSTKLIIANAISQGLHAQSVPYGLAAGAYLNVDANFAQAFGYNANVHSADSYAFVWNGDDGHSIGDYYASHGKGTFNINALSGINGIFIGEQSLAELFDEKRGNLVVIDDHISEISGRNDLVVVKLNASEYASLLANNQTLSNAIYIVQDDHIDAYGQQIKNVATPIDLSDATTKEYVDGVISNSLNDYYKKSETSSANEISIAIESISSGLADFYRKSETSSANEISTAIESIDTGNKIVIDDQISGISGRSDLSVVKLNASEYATLLTSDLLLSNALYVVNDVHMDAYGQQIKNIAPATDLSDAVNLEQMQQMLSSKANVCDLSDYYTKSETSAAADISNALAEKLNPSDVKIAYVSNSKQIVLSSRDTMTSVDCTDFIKDGMLSTAELCGTTLVLNFNTDAGSDPISVELSNFVDNYDNKINVLSDAIDNKIFVLNNISGISGYSDLSVIKLSANEYATLLTSNQLLSNALYIVEDTCINAYGQQLKNLAAPTDLSDAATKQYVDSSISNIEIPDDLSNFTNSPGYLVSNNLSDYCYFKNETSSANEISTALTSIDVGNKVFIDDHISGIVEQTDLSIVRLSSSEYEQLSANGQILSNALYIVEDSFTNNYGKQLKNIAPATDLSDAVNLEQMQQMLSSKANVCDLSDYYTKSETSSANEISTAIESIDVGNKVFIDDQISGISGYSDLSILKLDSAAYASILTSGSLLSNALYVVNDVHMDAYGQQIKNIAPATDLSDAVNFEQMQLHVSANISSTLGSIQKSLFNSIAYPAASVRSIQETLTQILNILRGQENNI